MTLSVDRCYLLISYDLQCPVCSKHKIIIQTELTKIYVPLYDSKHISLKHFLSADMLE